MVLVVGGAAAISDSVVSAIQALPAVTSVERIGGATRFATAAAVADRFVRATTAFIVSGEESAIADGMLAAGPAGSLLAPVLL